MSDDNIDNAAASDNNTDDATSGDDNAENVTKVRLVLMSYLHLYFMVEKQQIQVKLKTSKKHRPIRVKPLESSMDDPIADENHTKTVKGHAFAPTDVQVYEFFIQGAPNPKDLEGVEEDQLLDIQRTIKEKLKERVEERERNMTK